MRRPRTVVALSISAVAMALTFTHSSAQHGVVPHQGPASHGTHISEPAQRIGSDRLAARVPAQISAQGVVLAIDGAVTPELISDELAYRHFIAASAALSKGALVPQLPVVDAAGLSPADQLSYFSTLQRLKLHDELEALGRQRLEGSSTATHLSDAEAAALRRAIQEIDASMTPEGAATLRSHIHQHVKRRITVLSLGAHSSN